MGIFDLFNVKQFKQTISDLKQENQKLNVEINSLKNSIDNLTKENALLQKTLTDLYNATKQFYESITNENMTSAPTDYIISDNMTYRADSQEITDKDVSDLIMAGYNKAKEQTMQPANPKFHRTEKEEELSYKFEQKYGSQVSVLVNQFETLYRNAYNETDLDERVNRLQAALIAFQKAKSFCYSKGKGGTIYFQDMWEHLHNSTNDCFSYEDIIRNSLEEVFHEKDVTSKIKTVISENDGIMQKNIYSLIPDASKSEVQYYLKRMDEQNIITRIKKGNTYELHLN